MIQIWDDITQICLFKNEFMLFYNKDKERRSLKFDKKKRLLN